MIHRQGRRRPRLGSVTLGAGLAIASVAPAASQQGAAESWAYWAGDAGSTRYSRLDQIDRDNVADLEIAWRFKTVNFGPRPESTYRVTPLYVDGVVYATAGYTRQAVAIDAGTGETLWTYRLDEGERARTAPRPNSGRGVAYWADGADRRVLLVTAGYFMVSLDAATGRPDPAFGEDGIVDLKIGLGRPVDPVNARIGSTSPPIVVGDVIVVGAALLRGNAPDSREQPPAPVRGYDVRTGELLWTFHTIPRPGEPGHESWEDDSWTYTGNAAVWPPMSADLERGYVYLPVEAATGDFYGGHRPGDNLYSQSLVCLDARTGERVWHYQLIRHGIWDYDPPAAPILTDIVVDGREIEAVVQLTKHASLFVFDRVTGEPVWPIEERAVPQSDVPGERTAPTQPFPTKPAPFDRQGFTEDDLIDFTPELREIAARATSMYRMGPLFTPPSLIEPGGNQGTILNPGQNGGANWQGGAFDPESGILYVPSMTRADVIGMASHPERSDMSYIMGRSDFSGIRELQGIPFVKPPWGRITAIDLSTGEHVWMVANDDTPEFLLEHPLLEGVEMPRTGRPIQAGVLATRTLLFAGTGGGTMTRSTTGVFRAHDKATGEILAEIELPSHQTGVPMTYLHEGRQYILVAVAGRGVPGELVALTLPR